MLSQTTDQGDHPSAFYSRKFLKRERYTTMVQEGLAIVEACKHFLSYLVGRKFTIMTDNRALQFLKNKDPTTGCLSRWMDTLRDLDFEVKHCPAPMAMLMVSHVRRGQNRTLPLKEGGC